MKKSLLTALCIALCAALSIGGTLAYLSDSEEAVNVMTVGKVDIELNEYQRSEDGTKLEPFTNPQNLMPIVGSAQCQESSPFDKWGLPTAKNYVDKLGTVTNTGRSDAYVRLIYGFPTALGSIYTPEELTQHGRPSYETTYSPLHWNVGNRVDMEGTGADRTLYTTSSANTQTPGQPWFDQWGGSYVTLDETVTIDGVEYSLTVFTSKTVLKPGESTVSPIAGFYLDMYVDYDDENDKWVYRKFNDPAFGKIYEELDYDLDNGVAIPVMAQAVQVEGFESNPAAAFAAAFGDTLDDNGKLVKIINPWAEADILPTVVYAENSEELQTAIEQNTNAVVTLPEGEFETNVKVAGGSDITIEGNGKDTVINGQIATTASNAGTLTLRNLTINVSDAIQDSTGISQTGKSAIAIWGDQTVICENVTFNMDLENSTAITSWWDTGKGTSIIVKNCTFNCNGQRPIRATGNVTVENCTFNDPYRYAVQLTAKADTATELDKAIINFHNNTIVNGDGGKAFVYGIQLEGADYGCNDCVINGSGNTMVNGGEDSTMYYCECGKVDHDTIEWNVETAPEHEA